LQCTAADVHGEHRIRLFSVVQ